MASKSLQITPKVIVLDVYETLLDMGQIERKVNDLFRSKRGYRFWFEMFMEYCFVENCTGRFNDFSSIGSATLKMASTVFDVTIDDDDVEMILGLLKQLPVHDGVEQGLSQLNDMNLRIAALTNSGEATVCERMERTGLISYFEKVMSAEHVRKYKPDKAVYVWAANSLKVPVGEILFVSVHGWDLAGAENAGMQTAFIKQRKQVIYPLAPVPALTCKNLTDLANQLKTSAGTKGVRR